MHADQIAAVERVREKAVHYCYELTFSNGPSTCEVFGYFRPGPVPFVNPDGSTTNVYGPLGWHRLDELPDKAAEPPPASKEGE